MKIAPLLAQFLYTHKRLDLPGIGTFLMDPSVNTEPENPKQGKPVLVEGVSFEHDQSVKETPELIQFISAHTGKIKALASADLDSHLQLAKQFINIGKPFLFEGIGSISKVQSGSFVFSPGQLITDKLKDVVSKEASTTMNDEPASDYKSVFYNKPAKANWKKPLIILLLLIGIVLAIWGGYRVYKITTAKNKKQSAGEVVKNETTPVNDSAQAPKDTSGSTPTTTPTTPATTSQVTAPTVVPSGNYKFVVETADKTRALARFNRLHTIKVPVQMETSDSVTFNLYFIIPAAISDTAHILDSLRRNYTPPGKRAYITN